MERMLRPEDIREHTGFGEKKTDKLIKLDGFPKIKVGRDILIPEDEYIKWYKANIGKEIILKWGSRMAAFYIEKFYRKCIIKLEAELLQLLLQ